MVVSPLVAGIVPRPLVVILVLLVRRMRRVLLRLLVKVARPLLLPVAAGELHQLLPGVPPLVAGQRLLGLLVGRLV